MTWRLYSVKWTKISNITITKFAEWFSKKLTIKLNLHNDNLYYNKPYKTYIWSTHIDHLLHSHIELPISLWNFIYFFNYSIFIIYFSLCSYVYMFAGDFNIVTLLGILCPISKYFCFVIYPLKFWRYNIVKMILEMVKSL